jgi:uncharacterized membrane protein YdjX (TVP38/TMEM64 family)
LKKSRIGVAIGVLTVIALFVWASYLIQTNLDYARDILGQGAMSVIIYVVIIIMSVVIAPVSALPLLPVAVGLWGWFFAALINIFSWTLGSVIAFLLARKYGAPLVRNFVSLEKLQRYERMIPEENMFWGIILLRISIPVDVLSYVLGLFSIIKFRTYALATLVGIAPLAFVLAYVGGLSIGYQIGAIIIAGTIMLIGYFARKGYGKALKKHSRSKASENVAN